MPTNGASPSAETSYSERGYMALSWSSGGVSYFAVSDAAVEELASFVKLFKTAATAGAAPP